MTHFENQAKQIDGLELIFIELPKFKAQNFTDRKLQYLWLKFLTEINEDTTEIPEYFKNDVAISKAIDLVQTSGFTEDELLYYEQYWDSVRIEKTALYEKFTKGKLEGKIEGKLEGKLEGKIEGKFEIAKLMKASGESIEKISLFTGLSKEEIEIL